MAKKSEIIVKDVSIRTMKVNGTNYLSITDIAKQKNNAEPKDVVKNWMRQKNTLEYLGLWERLHNPTFKGVEFDPLLAEAGSNSFTMSPSRWVELTVAIGITTTTGRNGGTYAITDIAFKFANLINDSIPQGERLVKLNKIAIQQMRVLTDDEGRKLLK